MNDLLIKEPVSSHLPEFHQYVNQQLETGKVAIVLLRYSHAGGGRDYFLVRSSQDFAEVLKRTLPKTSITVFFESHFNSKGEVNDVLCEQAVALLRERTDDDEEIVMVRLDSTQTELDVDQCIYFTDPGGIREWCSLNAGVRVLMGRLDFWKENGPTVMTAYVPDKDGVVRYGVY